MENQEIMFKIIDMLNNYHKYDNYHVSKIIKYPRRGYKDKTINQIKKYYEYVHNKYLMKNELIELYKNYRKYLELKII